MEKMSSITFPDGSQYEVVDDEARKDIVEINNNVSELNEFVGIKKNNYIPYPYANVKTENGIVFTDLGNGRIKANGKTSGSSSYYLQNNFKPSCSGKKVILSIKSTSTQASVFFRLWGVGGTYIEKYDFNIIERNGEITIDMPNATEYSYASVELFYNDAMDVDDIVEIMIRDADIEDDTYEPYVPSVNEPQVISLKTGLTLIIQGKLAILKFEGYRYTHNETIISDDKYKPNGQIYRNMMRAYTSDAKYYDGLVSVKNDGTITMSYLSSQGTGTNNVASGQLYGELIYLIK